MNWELLGHEWAVTQLMEQIVQDKLRHAYLFTGPQGIGRRTLALRLAQALNCPQPAGTGEPCQTCRTCQQIERMQHPDLAIVQAEQRGGTLKVEQIRELQRSLSLAPYAARYRVAVLLHFEEANASASNALLKTLEEPAAQVVLIITAESAESLLPTIVSRCEVLRLRTLPVDQVRLWLQARWGLSPEQAHLLAHISGGRPGYALRLHQEPDLFNRRQAWLTELLHLLAARRVERFAYAENLAKDKDSLRQALFAWLSLARDVLLRSAGSIAPVTNPHLSTEIESLAARMPLETAQAFVADLEKTLELIDKNVNARLATEVLFLNLPQQVNLP
jgi:DNA polymerase-3 subunit delta'